ncbi:glycosyl hydrolase [Microbacterium sp. NPDC079995]|uniref:glycosyl hydrolase n=1 Tax=unclassified Microbacterium TaxID=2609290 RepID=UPI0034509BF2
MSQFDDHRDALAHPPIEVRPEVRWWLAEGLHTDATLRSEVASAHRLGFGGMEFLAMEEEGIDHSRYGWGAEEWIHDSAVVVRETTSRGMAVSFTSGTNWANANLPSIHPDHPAAARELNFVTIRATRSSPFSGTLPRIDLREDRGAGPASAHRVPPTQQHFEGAVAVAMMNDGNLDEGSAVDLTDLVDDDRLEWVPDDDQTWLIFVFWSHGTGQTAAPSATVNYTVNYLDRDGVEAVMDYWSKTVLTDELRSLIAKNPRAQMYMDSLELFTWGAGGMFWGHSLRWEFRERRGYDILRWLPFLVREVRMMAADTRYHYSPLPSQVAIVEKVRHDYVRTLTDLYIENMLQPFSEFLHGNGLTLRAEISYGLPFELTRPGTAVDGIETESLEFGSQIDAYRLLAGPAHLFDKQYSSETGATTRSHMLDHRFYDQIIRTQFAGGVTRTVLHGWASTAGGETSTEWPGHEGMWSMFSERFDTRQPASEFYPLWNDSVGRYQYLLRQGKPRIDVGILRTDHFVDTLSGLTLLDGDGNRIADEDAYGHRWMRARDNHWWQDLGMQDAGWTYEFFDASLLAHEDVSFADGVVQPDGPGYQALVIYQETLDADAAALLLDWARKGLRVLIVNGARELKLLRNGDYTTHLTAASRTPGLDGRDAELAATVEELRALPSVREIADPSRTVEALRDLGVMGRAEFAANNENILTALREDGDLLHLFAYHFLYETGREATVDIVLPRLGKVYQLDAATGRMSPHLGVRSVGDRTQVTVTLTPGESTMLTLDGSAEPADSPPAISEVIAEMSTWDIAVESWDAGDNELIVEDRGLGYESREIKPRTSITRLNTPDTSLRPWRDLPGIGPEVSGIGEYRASFTLPPQEASARVVLDLGSTGGALGSVSVNGGTPTGFDTSHPIVDITEFVAEGTNRVLVRVASSLNNRLIARGYYDHVPDAILMMAGREGTHRTVVRDYGLLGPVTVSRLREEVGGDEPGARLGPVGGV